MMFFYLATVHFQSCTLNVNKIDVVLCFRKLICAFSLTCFKVRICKISDKSDTFSLNYSDLFMGPLFSGHSVTDKYTAVNIWCREPCKTNPALTIDHTAFSGRHNSSKYGTSIKFLLWLVT